MKAKIDKLIERYDEMIVVLRAEMNKPKGYYNEIDYARLQTKINNFIHFKNELVKISNYKPKVKV